MEEIIVKTQEELDKIPDDFKGLIIIRGGTAWNKIYVKKSYYYRVEARGNSSVEAWENSSVVAWENSSVVARGNSSVEARGNSSVEAWENSSVEARENSSVVAWGNSSVEAWENSSVVARENSSVVAWENSSVVAWENSSVVAWGNSSVEARGNSSVVAWGNSVIRIFYEAVKVILHGFSVAFLPININLNVDIKKQSETATIIRPEYKPGIDAWLDREGIENKDKVILFKKVSKDFKTQEGTKNETKWKIGKKNTHKNWKPGQQECGEGKFHACSRPYFCDEFRNERGDQYIAIEIKKEDLFVWDKNPEYPHKVVFREGKVLYKCNKFGKKL
jgi:hypothetical protein